MENTQRKWFRIIGLDLSRQMFKSCILSEENFTYKARLKEDSDYRVELAEELLSESGLSLTSGMMCNDQINLVQLQIENHEERLRQICLDHPRQALSWLSIPGIGLVNAATLIAYVGDGSRFSRADQLLNYAGMVPKLNQSGTVDITGKSRNVVALQSGGMSYRRPTE